MEESIVYFEKTGDENTLATFTAAKNRAEALGINTVIVASTRGVTAVKAVEAFKGYKLIIVTHSYGSVKANAWTFTDENLKIIQAGGATVVTAAHALAGLSRAVKNKYGGGFYGDYIADTLRIFGHGMKVCCEIAMMAADAGHVKSGEDVIAIGGTGGGADTAAIVLPANSHRFFEMKVREIICKPRL